MQDAPARNTPKLSIKNGMIDMTHGAGGRAMHALIERVFCKAFNNPWLNQQEDQAQLTIPQERLVMTTDAHVISPLFFPGGNIGSLAINGTVNDVAMAGAKPLYIAASFILEAGLPLQDLQNIVNSMAIAAKQAGVAIVTGDTKVVEKGKGDGVFITTTGIGVIENDIHISAHNAKVGDKIIINGFIGDHGIAILSQREGLNFGTPVISDTANLNDLVAHMVNTTPNIHCMRDPTRGGLATTLNELASQSKVGMQIMESQIPVRTEVASACELLGLDPLYIANEGKLVAICDPKDAESLLQSMQAYPLGKQAAIIGEVIEDSRHFVQLQTQFGGTRIVDWLTGDPLPRIC